MVLDSCRQTTSGLPHPAINQLSDYNCKGTKNIWNTQIFSQLFFCFFDAFLENNQDLFGGFGKSDYLCGVKITNMKTRTEILQLLKRYKPTAQKKYGMTKIGIFGSVARGEQKEDSDVDVCYEGEAPSFITLDLIQSELEELLGSKVDIVRVRDNMNSLLRQRIIRDGIYV